jgi:hypothetical protein
VWETRVAYFFGRYVDLVCEDVVDERFCDGEVESDHQLAEGLLVGKRVPSFVKDVIDVTDVGTTISLLFSIQGLGRSISVVEMLLMA